MKSENAFPPHTLAKVANPANDGGLSRLLAESLKAARGATIAGEPAEELAENAFPPDTLAISAKPANETNHQQAAADDGPRATIWHVWTPDAEIDAIRGTPMSRAEILADFPDAIAAEPRNLYGKPNEPSAATDEAEEPATVTCSACKHFEPGTSPAAVGRCLIDAPSSEWHACWAFAPRRCHEWEPATEEEGTI
jgi:hypothetical protein